MRGRHPWTLLHLGSLGKQEHELCRNHLGNHAGGAGYLQCGLGWRAGVRIRSIPAPYLLSNALANRTVESNSS